jgi:hypothetical protein
MKGDAVNRVTARRLFVAGLSPLAHHLAGTTNHVLRGKCFFDIAS